MASFSRADSSFRPAFIRFFLCLLRLVRFLPSERSLPSARFSQSACFFLLARFSPSVRFLLAGQARPLCHGVPPSAAVRIFLPPHMVGGAASRILPELPGGLRAMLAQVAFLRRRVPLPQNAGGRKGRNSAAGGFLLRAILAEVKVSGGGCFGLAFFDFFPIGHSLLSRNKKKPASQHFCVLNWHTSLLNTGGGLGYIPRGGAHGKS